MNFSFSLTHSKEYTNWIKERERERDRDREKVWGRIFQLNKRKISEIHLFAIVLEEKIEKEEEKIRDFMKKMGMGGRGCRTGDESG